MWTPPLKTKFLGEAGWGIFKPRVRSNRERTAIKCAQTKRRDSSPSAQNDIRADLVCHRGGADGARVDSSSKNEVFGGGWEGVLSHRAGLLPAGCSVSHRPRLTPFVESAQTEPTLPAKPTPKPLQPQRCAGN